jgi:growth factor-regulated tyrosine kinase substrate
LLGTPSSISSSLTPAYTPSIKNKNATTESNNLTTTATATSNSNTLATSGANDDQFEDDLKKAIEMSLKETEQQKKLGYYSGTTTDNTNNSTTTTSKKSAEEEEEEANVAAAIAASLQDMNTNHCYTNTATSPKYNSNELSSIDMENIQLFSTLMQRVQSAGGDVPGDAQINKLYTQIGTLQPKLVKTLDETSQKHGKTRTVLLIIYILY